MIDSHTYTVKEIAEIGECVRKWTATHLHRLPDPRHPAAEAGIQMHALLEAMLKQGPQANANPESEVGSWARALYPLAPAGCHAELAQPFEIDLSPLTGVATDRFNSSFKIDFVFPDFSGFGDWKSCGGARWALDEVTLPVDLQLNLESYGFAKVMGFPRDRLVSLLWAYVDKKTHKSWPVGANRSFEQAEAWLAEHALHRLRLIRAMRRLAAEGQTPAIRAVPHELTACGGSGRFCNYLGACQFQPSTAGLTTEALYQLVK